MKKVIIVESPTKAKTIKNYMKDYEVFATKGHFINLPKKELAIEFKEKKLNIKWIVSNPKVLSFLKKNISNEDIVYIATDDDREGEKIASDVKEYCNIKNPIRLRLNEITKQEIEKKINKKDKIDKNIVNAAVTRRVIDRYIGYPLSNAIKYAFIKEKRKRLPNGIGRVIAPALNILVTREKEIEGFTQEKYKKIMIEYNKNNIEFRAKSKLTFSEDEKKELESAITQLSTMHYVKFYKKKTEDRQPPPPLITSTLQYASWYLYYIKPKETMKIAQELFENGLITYHRTDSLRISNYAYGNIVTLLKELATIDSDEILFNENDILETYRKYKNKTNAQDAHEAIRITNFTFEYSPFNHKLLELFKKMGLNEKHLKIYNLIWYRTMAIQLKDSIYDVSFVVIETKIGDFKAQANNRLYSGWEKLKGNLLKSSISSEEDYYQEEMKLPMFEIDEAIKPKKIIIYDYTPQRPRRFGIGRFVSTLYNKGIARPSTLDSIVENLERKNYITINKGIIIPTPLGIEIIEWMDKNISWLINENTSAQFEEELEEIEKGDKNYMNVIEKYFTMVDNAIKNIGYNENEFNEKLKYKQNIKCPNCKNILVQQNNCYICDKCNFKFCKKALSNFLKSNAFNFNENAINEIFEFLTKNRYVYLENFKSKKGNIYSAFIKLNYDKKYGSSFEIIFPKDKVHEKYLTFLKMLNYINKVEKI